MVILNEHFKEVEKRLGLPQEAIEAFEKAAYEASQEHRYEMLTKGSLMQRLAAIPYFETRHLVEVLNDPNPDVRVSALRQITFMDELDEVAKDAEEEKPIPFDEQVECDRRGREAYGDFKNVYLSEYEYQDLKIRFPLDYRKRINDLSYYINAKGNKYASHYGAILNWNRNKNAEGESQTSTFDTDEFFQSAVERSKAKAAERRKNKANEDN